MSAPRRMPRAGLPPRLRWLHFSLAVIVAALATLLLLLAGASKAAPISLQRRVVDPPLPISTGRLAAAPIKELGAEESRLTSKSLERAPLQGNSQGGSSSDGQSAGSGSSVGFSNPRRPIEQQSGNMPFPPDGQSGSANAGSNSSRVGVPAPPAAESNETANAAVATDDGNTFGVVAVGLPVIGGFALLALAGVALRRHMLRKHQATVTSGESVAAAGGKFALPSFLRERKAPATTFARSKGSCIASRMGFIMTGGGKDPTTIGLSSIRQQGGSSSHATGMPPSPDPSVATMVGTGTHSAVSASDAASGVAAPLPPTPLPDANGEYSEMVEYGSLQVPHIDLVDGVDDIAQDSGTSYLAANPPATPTPATAIRPLSSRTSFGPQRHLPRRTVDNSPIVTGPSRGLFPQLTTRQAGGASDSAVSAALLRPAPTWSAPAIDDMQLGTSAQQFRVW